MKLLLEVLDRIRGKGLIDIWTNDNKLQICGLIVEALEDVENKLNRRIDELHYGFREFFRESIALMLYAMGFYLMFKYKEIPAKIERTVELLENKARILRLIDTKYFREILKNLRLAYSKYKDPTLMDHPHINDLYFHLDSILKVYHSFLAIFSSGQQLINAIFRYSVQISKLLNYTKSLALILKRKVLSTRSDYLLVAGIANLLHSLTQKLLDGISKIFTRMCVKALGNNVFWDNLKKPPTKKRRILRNLECLRNAIETANNIFVGTSLIEKELGDTEFDGYIEVLGEDSSGSRRHFVIMIVECKLEMFSDEYYEVERIQKQIEKHIELVKSKIVPYFRFLYGDKSPLIAYFLLVNRRLSTNIEELLKELQNRFKSDDYKLCISFLTHKALKRAIVKYASESSRDLIELIFGNNN